MTLIVQVEIENGSYSFELPSAFYPDYARHGVEQDAFTYGFNYDFTISSQSRIQNLSIPKDAEVTDQNENGTKIQINGHQRSRKVNFFWRSRDMLTPNLLFARSSVQGHENIACMASFVPNFEPPAPQEEVEVVKG